METISPHYAIGHVRIDETAARQIFVYCGRVVYPIQPYLLLVTRHINGSGHGYFLTSHCRQLPSYECASLSGPFKDLVLGNSHSAEGSTSLLVVE